jgi:hypothetical protein
LNISNRLIKLFYFVKGSFADLYLIDLMNQLLVQLIDNWKSCKKTRGEAKLFKVLINYGSFLDSRNDIGFVLYYLSIMKVGFFCNSAVALY